jgi:hypothetical protein
MVWQKLGSDTLTSAGDKITVSGFTAKKFNQVLTNKFPDGASTANIQLGSTSIDTGNNYAYRWSESGTADQTTVNTDKITHDVFYNSTKDTFLVAYINNISSEEKLCISFSCGEATAGAGTAPYRSELVGKWVNTDDQYDIIEANNDGAGDFDVNSNLTDLGTD